METLATKDEPDDSNVAVKGASSQQLAEVTRSIAKLECEPSMRRGGDQACDHSHDSTLVPNVEKPQLNKEQDAPKEKAKYKRKERIPPINNKGVRCMCGDYEQDLGMVQCDECKAWEHVVCAGYFSNSDKRLETADKRSCYYCEYGQSSQAVHIFLRELCRMRRALSVMYGEGFGNCQVMSKRLGNQIIFIVVGMSVVQFVPIYKRLEAEGFVRKIQEASSHGPVAYKVQKTLEAKAKIKEYFVLDLVSIEGFAKLVGVGKQDCKCRSCNSASPKATQTKFVGSRCFDLL